jgi:hypothetical protein
MQFGNINTLVTLRNEESHHGLDCLIIRFLLRRNDNNICISELPTTYNLKLKTYNLKLKTFHHFLTNLTFLTSLP